MTWKRHPIRPPRPAACASPSPPASTALPRNSSGRRSAGPRISRASLRCWWRCYCCAGGDGPGEHADRVITPAGTSAKCARSPRRGCRCVAPPTRRRSLARSPARSPAPHVGCILKTDSHAARLQWRACSPVVVYRTTCWRNDTHSVVHRTTSLLNGLPSCGALQHALAARADTSWSIAAHLCCKCADLAPCYSSARISMRP